MTFLPVDFFTYWLYYILTFLPIDFFTYWLFYLGKKSTVFFTYWLFYLRSRKILFCISMCKYAVTSNESRSSFLNFFLIHQFVSIYGGPNLTSGFNEKTYSEYKTETQKQCKINKSWRLRSGLNRGRLNYKKKLVLHKIAKNEKTGIAEFYDKDTWISDPNQKKKLFNKQFCKNQFFTPPNPSDNVDNPHITISSFQLNLTRTRDWMTK